MVFIHVPFLIKLSVIIGLSYILNFFLVKYMNIFKILDIPNERSSHLHVIPRSGGIAIFIAFLVGLWLFQFKFSYLFLIPLCIVFLVGLYDDIYSLSSKIKLMFTTIAAAILFFIGFDIQHFGTFFGNEVILGFWISLLFYCFAVSGFVSALNLIDGLDGLASLVSLAILFPFAYIGFKYSDVFLVYVTLVTMCSIAGFLMLNWHPAKIFMGDSGSMLLGFIISLVVVYSIQKDYITAVSVLLLAAVPILDTLIVMLRRLVSRKNPFYADKTHIHHIFLKQQQGNTRKTVLLVGLIQILFSYLGLGFKVRDDIFILILYMLCFVLFYFILTPSEVPKNGD